MNSIIFKNLELRNIECYEQLKHLNEVGGVNYSNYRSLGLIYQETCDLSEEFLGCNQGDEGIQAINYAAHCALSTIISRTLNKKHDDGFVFSENSRVSRLFARCNSGGFSNRLRFLANVTAISEIFNLETTLLWLQNVTCPAPFSSIFDVSKIVPVKPIEYMDSIQLMSESSIEITVPFSAWVFWEKYVKSSSTIDWNNYKNLYLGKLRALFACIKHSIIEPAILFSDAHIKPHTIGLHIRGTDFVNHFKLGYPDRSYPEVEDYIDMLVKINAKHIFLSTDDSIMLEALKSYSQHEITYYPHNYSLASFRQTSVASAIVDLFILSKCSVILGTYGSSFSEMAADIGGIERIQVG